MYTYMYTYCFFYHNMCRDHTHVYIMTYMYTYLGGSQVMLVQNSYMYTYKVLFCIQTCSKCDVYTSHIVHGIITCLCLPGGAGMIPHRRPARCCCAWTSGSGSHPSLSPWNLWAQAYRGKTAGWTRPRHPSAPTASCASRCWSSAPPCRGCSFSPWVKQRIHMWEQ